MPLKFTRPMQSPLAAGREPVYVAPLSAMPAVNSATTSVSKVGLIDKATKIDCFYQIGGIEFEQDTETEEEQYACEANPREVPISTKTTATLTINWDQQKALTEDINAAYNAMPEGSDVILFIAHGYASDQELTVGTVGDLYVMTVQKVKHLFAEDAKSRIRAEVTLTGSVERRNVKVTA